MTHASMPTEAGDRQRPPGYHAFLLRLWCGDDGAGWRASLQAPGDAERRGFADLDGLVAHLRALCCPPDAAPGPRGEAGSSVARPPAEGTRTASQSTTR